MIVTTDSPKYSIVCATDNFFASYQKNESDILKKGFFEIFDHIDNGEPNNKITELLALFSSTIEKKTLGKLEHFYIKPKKNDHSPFEPKYVDIEIVPVLNENGLTQSIIVSLKENENKAAFNNVDSNDSQHYRSVLENSLIAFFLTKPDGTIVEANKAACDLFGYSMEDLKQIGRQGTIDHSDIDVHEKIKERSETGKLKAEFTGIKKSGEKFPIEVSSFLFLDLNGEERTSTSIIDITVRKNAEKSLLKSEYYLNEAQQMAKMGSWSYDLPQDKLSWTDGLYVIFDADKDTFLETYGSFVNLVVDEDRAFVLETSKHAQLTGDPFNIEYRITTPKGDSRIIEEFGYSEKNTNGDIVRLFGTAQDITERKLTEQVLKISEKKYKTLFEDNPLPMVIWDFETLNIIDCNEEALLKYGYTREEFLQLSIRDIRPKEDIALINAATANEPTYGQIHKQTWRHLKKNGELMIMEITAHLMHHDGRRVSLALLNDVTEREKTMQHLKLLESVITNTNDAVIICTAHPLEEPGPKIIYVNEAFVKMTGYTADEVIGKTPRILQGPKSDKKELARLGKALRNWESCEATTVNYKKNGEDFWVNFAVSPISDEKGGFTHWISIQRDVTPRKNEEQQRLLLSDISRLFNQPISFSESLNQVLQAIASAGNFCMAEAWIIDADKKNMNLLAKHALGDTLALFYAENADARTVGIGYGLPGIVGLTRTIQEWSIDQENDDFIRKNEAIKAGIKKIIGIPLFYNESIIGSFLLGSDSTEKMQNDLIFKSHDLSLHLGSEIKRKLLEKELTQVFNNSNDLICIADYNGYFKKINPIATEILGYTEEELLERPFADFIHPDDLNITAKEVDSLSKGQPTYYFENRYITKSGKIIWFAWSSTTSPAEKLMFAVAKDITEKKNLEVLLNKSNKLAAIGSWELDVINSKVYWSDVTKEIREVEPDFVPNLSTGISYFKEGESRETISQSVKECMENGTAWDEELQIITHKGNLKWIRTIGEAEMVNGKCIRIYGSFQDIDARKKAAIKLAESENRFRTILEAEPECIKLVDASGNLLMMNPAGLAMIEADNEEQVIGKSILRIILPEHRTAFSNLTKSVFKGGSGNLVFEIEGFKGTHRWMETHAVPMRNEQGNVISLLGITRDITVRKKAEETIRQSNERFEKVTQATNDVIWDWDIVNDNRIYLGSSFTSMIGFDVDHPDLRKYAWEKFLHPEDYPVIKESLLNAVADKNNYHWEGEYRFVTKNGNIIAVMDRGFIIRNDSGVATRMVGAITDITLRKENENSLRQLNEKLEQHTQELANSNKELEQFAYVASHDLQEPLRMVTSFLAKLETKYSDLVDDKGRQYIHFAVDGANRMRQIILDLLEFSMVGKLHNTIEQVNVNELISNIQVLLANQIEESNATIKVENLQVIECSRIPLSQVFQNLISNALKYRHNEKAPVITIVCEDIPGYWMFSIRDNGIGINKQNFEKIFVIFQRLHNKDEYTGTGIGLAIVNKIINKLDGKIWLESEEGNGSVFYFTLPKYEPK